MRNANLLSQPLTESLDMGFFLAEKYSVLQGPQTKIANNVRLLRELHALDYFSLTLARKPVAGRFTKHTVDTIEKKLAAPNISPTYRDALQSKHQL